MTSQDSITLADAAAEAIRNLNHTARHHDGLGQPSAAYDILGALSRTAAGLSQALTQITRYLGTALASGQLGHDHGHDPGPSISSTIARLDSARLTAATLASTLNAAQQQLAPINGNPRKAQDQTPPANRKPATST